MDREQQEQLDNQGYLLLKGVLSPARCALISDTNVAPRFGGQLQKNLIAAGYEATLITVPPGEQSKTLEQVGQICDQMLAAGLDRESFVIGLGGGVVGDLSGLVAAIFESPLPCPGVRKCRSPG